MSRDTLIVDDHMDMMWTLDTHEPNFEEVIHQINLVFSFLNLINHSQLLFNFRCFHGSIRSWNCHVPIFYGTRKFSS